jgi:hypothetical protein
MQSDARDRDEKQCLVGSEKRNTAAAPCDPHNQGPDRQPEPRTDDRPRGDERHEQHGDRDDYRDRWRI